MLIHYGSQLVESQQNSTPLTERIVIMTYKFKMSRRLASNHWRLFAFVGLAAILSACGGQSATGPSTGDSKAPVPGWLTVELTTPYNDDGAVQLRVTGAKIDSIVADSHYKGVGQSGYSSADLIVTGSVASGKVARFLVPDVERAAFYSVSVVAGAQRNTWALRNKSSYSATLVR
jgi:hypothetical protein